MELAASIISGIIIAVVSAMVTVRLSLHRFHSERWWEKKVVAYTTIIEALTHMQLYLKEQNEQEAGERQRDPQRETELSARSNQGRDELYRAACVGAFLISSEVSAAIERCLGLLHTAQEADNYWEYVDAEAAAVDECLQQVTKLAKRDLKVD